MSSKIPPVSVIIPALNEEHYLPTLLESLLQVDFILDIVVVDGHSTDRTVEMVAGWKEKFSLPSSLRVVTSTRGLSLQRNAGVREAKYEHLLFIDADVVIPSKNIFQKLIQSFVQSGNAVGVAHLMSYESTFRGRLVFAFFDAVQRTLLMFGRPYLGTFCLITTKDVFAKIGGFDEKKHITEDIDFCFRAAKIGHVKQLPVYVPVSERRFVKYGYWKIFWLYLKEGFIFLVTGTARINQIEYPFGTY